MCNLKMPFFDNKQLIHIAAESVLLVLMLFYFSLQNKKLKVGLNTCTKRVKEQELILQTHDKVLKNHDMILRNLVQGKNVVLPKRSSSKSKPPSEPLSEPPSSPDKVDLPKEEEPTIEVIEEEIKKELNELDENEKKNEKKNDESLEEKK